MAEADDLEPQDLPEVRVRRRRRSTGRPVENGRGGRWLRWGGMTLVAGLLYPLANAFPPLGLGLALVGLVLVGRGLQTRDSIWHRTRERSPDLLVGGILLLGVSTLALALNSSRLTDLLPNSAPGKPTGEVQVSVPAKNWP